MAVTTRQADRARPSNHGHGPSTGAGDADRTQEITRLEGGLDADHPRSESDTWRQANGRRDAEDRREPGAIRQHGETGDDRSGRGKDHEGGDESQGGADRDRGERTASE